MVKVCSSDHFRLSESYEHFNCEFAKIRHSLSMVYMLQVRSRAIFLFPALVECGESCRDGQQMRKLWVFSDSGTVIQNTETDH
jgi:hypothetical protein